MRKIALLCATSALVMPAMAHAQSTGTTEVEEETVVVTGARTQNGVEGIVVPDSARAQAVLTQENIQRQSSGQTILNAINIIPGVNFTQNDPFGSSGGNIRIRGFDGNRISLTFDGLPLNDTGNYAIFSNQQLDPELIERVSVNLGQTDVDSPTASAAGGTVNYRTLIPTREMGARVAASVGDFDFHRVFGMIQMGELWENGLRGWVSASTSSNDLFRGPGEVRKQQYNARLYYPIGSNGDFISLAGHYNENRSNFYRNPNINDIRTALGNTGTIPPASGAGNISFDNPAIIGGGLNDDQFDLIYGINNINTCTRDDPTAGARDNDAAGSSGNIADPASCTNYFDLRINPSNTGNIRINSRFTLAEGLILTIDPSFQYTLANGGGTQVLEESAPQLGGNSAGATPCSARAGRDLNGDGDVCDGVRVYTPNNTNTHRYGLTSSLIWQMNENHRFRVAYTFDYGEHRQTGEYGLLNAIGAPQNVFGGRNGSPILDTAGNPVQGRDRESIASLHQVAGQYVGRFLDRRLRVEIGLRAPFFHRELNQNCFTNTGLNPTTGQATGNFNTGGVGIGGGFTLCTPRTLAQVQALGATAAGFIAPFEQDYDFNAILPNVGAVYTFDNGLSVFASYARGFSAPRTDNLYRAVQVDIEPETTDAFDLGVRYTRSGIQAQATAWLINYQNRILTSFDPDLGISIDRNVGRVNSYGFDASIAWQPVEAITLYGFASYISAEFQEDIQLGFSTVPANTPLSARVPIFAPTRGRMVAETPEWQVGGRAQFSFGPVDIGVQGKWVDDRFATDVNDVIVSSYATVDLDARVSLAPWGLDRTFVQLNVINLFDRRYIGSISSQINAGQICPTLPAGQTCSGNTNNPSFTPGSPRTFVATLNVGF